MGLEGMANVGLSLEQRFHHQAQHLSVAAWSAGSNPEESSPFYLQFAMTLVVNSLPWSAKGAADFRLSCSEPTLGGKMHSQDVEAVHLFAMSEM